MAKKLTVKRIDDTEIWSPAKEGRGVGHFLLQLLGIVIVAGLFAWVFIGVMV